MGTTGIPESSRQTMSPRRVHGKPAGVYHYSRKKRRLQRVLMRSLSLFMLFFLLFIGFRFAPFQPFEGLRNLWVTTAMTTLNHQYLATWFFSDDAIKKIMDTNQAADLGNSNPLAINILGKKNQGIELIDISQKGYKGYLLKIKDPSRVQVAATSYLGTRGEKAGEIAEETGAVAVINGGAFSDPEGNGNGGKPMGILISGGKVLYKDTMSSYDLIGFDSKNRLILGQYTLTQIQKMGIRDAVSFDPFLVVNGKPAITQGDGGWGIAPRTAIGQAKDGTVFMLVIDGRQIGSVGASLKDVQDIMLKHGAYNVANLDGGASSVLYYQQKLVNKPSSPYGERYLPSFFMVK